MAATTHQDFKGHHPKVRPYNWHDKIHARRKVLKLVSPKVWQLAMMKLGMAFVETRKVCYGSDYLPDASTNSTITLTSMTLEVEMVGCSDAGICYVNTESCGILQANPANPPPRNGFLWNVLNWLKGFFMQKPRLSHILSLAVLMAIATACKKQNDPNSNNTNDPVIPTREIVIDWNCSAHLGWAPPIDTLRYYTQQNDVKSVTIHLFDRTGHNYPINCSTFRPSMFDKWRKQIEPCVYLDPRVKLSGGIRTPRDDFTSNSDTILEYGIASFDKAWFEKYGMTFFIGHVSTSK